MSDINRIIDELQRELQKEELEVRNLHTKTEGFKNDITKAENSLKTVSAEIMKKESEKKSLETKIREINSELTKVTTDMNKKKQDNEGNKQKLRDFQAQAVTTKK